MQAIALILTFSILQLSVQGTLAGKGGTEGTASTKSKRPNVARLTTRGNYPILVNGNNAESGDTILTGAKLITPGGTGATINGPFGSLDLAPDTLVKLDYGDGAVNVLLTRGCVILRTNKNTIGKVATEEGSAASTLPPKAGVIDICFTAGAPVPIVNKGAAEAAGVGATGQAQDRDEDRDGRGGWFGLDAGDTALLISSVAAGIVIPIAVTKYRKHLRCHRQEREEQGENPSPREPDNDNEDCAGEQQEDQQGG